MELNYLLLHLLSHIPCEISQALHGFLAYPLGIETQEISHLLWNIKSVCTLSFGD